MTHDDTAPKAADGWKWKGTWLEFKGRARQLWGDLTDDDLDVAEGKFEEVLGRIQRKTGEAMEDIERKFS